MGKDKVRYPEGEDVPEKHKLKLDNLIEHADLWVESHIVELDVCVDILEVKCFLDEEDTVNLVFITVINFRIDVVISEQKEDYCSVPT